MALCNKELENLKDYLEEEIKKHWGNARSRLQGQLDIAKMGLKEKKEGKEECRFAYITEVAKMMANPNEYLEKKKNKNEGIDEEEKEGENPEDESGVDPVVVFNTTFNGYGPCNCEHCFYGFSFFSPFDPF